MNFMFQAVELFLALILFVLMLIFMHIYWGFEIVCGKKVKVLLSLSFLILLLYYLFRFFYCVYLKLYATRGFVRAFQVAYVPEIPFTLLSIFIKIRSVFKACKGNKLTDRLTGCEF